MDFGVIDSLYQFTYVPRLEPAINQNAKNARALTGSIFDIYSRYRSGLKTNQEPVDS